MFMNSNILDESKVVNKFLLEITLPGGEGGGEYVIDL